MAKKPRSKSSVDCTLARGLAASCPKCGRNAACTCETTEPALVEDLVLPSEQLSGRRFSRRYEGWEPSTAHR